MPVPVTTSNRRIGAEDSKSREQLLDAAEHLLLAEGYAAVTSRRVAAAAGLKPQLVHYYFRTMDDLFLEVFRRRAEQNLARFDQAAATVGSIKAFWQLNHDPRAAAFMIEFVALANHRKVIRAEIAGYAERFRVAQVAALQAVLAGRGIDEQQLPPLVAVLLMTGLTQVMAIEHGLGVTGGHDSVVEYVERVIAELEAG